MDSKSAIVFEAVYRLNKDEAYGWMQMPNPDRLNFRELREVTIKTSTDAIIRLKPDGTVWVWTGLYTKET